MYLEKYIKLFFITIGSLMLIGKNTFGQKSPYIKADTLRVLEMLKEENASRDSVFKFAKEALKISESIGFAKGIALSKEKMVNYFHAKSDYGNAVAYSLELIDSFERLGMMEKCLFQQLTLSTIYKHMGAERGTVDYLLKGLNLAVDSELRSKKLGLNMVLIESLNNQGIILRDLSYIQEKPFLLDSALVKYEKALESLQKTKGDPQVEQMLYNNMSQVYIERLKDYDKAAEVLNKAVLINHRINNQNNLSYNYANLSNLYFYQKDYSKAKEYALKMLKIGEDLGRPHRVLNAYNHLKKISSSAMDFNAAYEYSEKMAALNDSLTNITKTEQIADYQTKYETVKKELKITTLNKENELKSKQTFWVSILGLVLLIGLGLSIWNFNILQKKKEVIEKQSEVIQTSLTEKETLLREIHHRVKNNLQIISSLLNIQSSHIEDQNVLSSIKEGQSRVQAMSLIHQNLYQSEHINNVDIENYLKELVKYLSDMFTGGEKNIEVEVSAQNIQFDIDTAIPLGLIVNELVSNAYKYAFANKESGHIKIGIKPINDVDFELHVDDDGNGLPEDFNPVKNKSLGLKLVKILSKQLRGKFSSKSNNGANFTVFFKDIRAYQKL
jgi:two-component system, sensor histidine kinase PdtaS